MVISVQRLRADRTPKLTGRGCCDGNGVFFSPRSSPMLPELSPEALHAAQLASENILVIDVREPEEYDYCHLPGSRLIPLGELAARAAEIPADVPVVLLCHHGVRSAQALLYLEQRHGLQNLRNLRGGIHAWSLRVDPSVPVY